MADGIREGFRALTDGWSVDSFDALMARIDIVGDWVTQNGGPDQLTPAESKTVVKMMTVALLAGKAGAVPKRETRQ